MEDEANLKPHLINSFFPEPISSNWPKKCGKSGFGKGTQCSAAAWTGTFPFHSSQLLRSSSIGGSCHHHTAKHCCSPPLIPRSSRCLRRCGIQASLYSPTKICIEKYYLDTKLRKKRVRKVLKHKTPTHITKKQDTSLPRGSIFPPTDKSLWESRGKLSFSSSPGLWAQPPVWEPLGRSPCNRGRMGFYFRNEPHKPQAPHPPEVTSSAIWSSTALISTNPSCSLV